MSVPQEAIDAAAEAMAARSAFPVDAKHVRDLATAALEAAAPHITAAERQRCGLCTSCAARYQDGIVWHEDNCPRLRASPGEHDCQASASGFCGHPAHQQDNP